MQSMRVALVLQVHSLSVRAKGKLLLENTQLSVTAGRRYGLVGPNGKGKSTLLRLIARRQIPVPEGLDVLLVEQVGLCYHLPGCVMRTTIMQTAPLLFLSYAADPLLHFEPELACVNVSCALL